MESASREEARSSGSGGEETPRPGREGGNCGDEEDEEMITGPSYDCVFCKRGFTTAQALGGHMNIHRKDRAKAKPPLSSPAVLLPKKPEENFVNSGFCLSILSYKPPNPAAPEEAQIKYQEYILAAAAAADPDPDPMDVDHQKQQQQPQPQPQQQQQISSVCKEDWRTCLSLQVGPSCGYEYDTTKDIINRKDEKIKEDELDLELRLGHNPS